MIVRLRPPLSACSVFIVWERRSFFFSSRRRHTRLVSDWSSDVCSSDLCRLCPLPMADDPGQAYEHEEPERAAREEEQVAPARSAADLVGEGLLEVVVDDVAAGSRRSEERRVGKEGRSRGSPYH